MIRSTALSALLIRAWELVRNSFAALPLSLSMRVTGELSILVVFRKTDCDYFRRGERAEGVTQHAFYDTNPYVSSICA